MGKTQPRYTSNDFFVETEGTAESPVLRVHGEVDMVTAEELRVAVFDALEYATHLEIDLEATSFLDSQGLTVLIGASRRFGFDPKAVVVRHARPSSRKVLTITGIELLIDLVE